VNRAKGQERLNITRAAMRDIAERAGVSIATVSRVLNGRPDVSAATRAAVLQYVREVGYVSNRVARTSLETSLIGLALPALRGDHLTEIVAGIVDALYAHEARLVICATADGHAHGGSLRARLLQGVTDGALLISPQEPDGELAALQQSNYPFVVIDPIMPLDHAIPVVASANWAGAKMAAEHLIGLGHTHIGIVTGPAEHAISADRLAGYQAALLAAGLPLTPALIQTAELTVDGGARAAHHLLARAHTPSAIFALSDQLAVGVLRAARERQLAVPADLSVVGFDDVRMAALVTPALTTVQQPFQGLGHIAVDVLYRLLQGQPLPAMRVELSTRLVVRDSTAPPPTTSFLTY
jgi:DNA-binding LacI/PurR family transcriptional regulator